MDINEALLEYLSELNTAQREKLSLFYALLTDWNERMNLTAITEPADVAQKHFADSILPVSLMPHGAHCIDVGTGAGFPGIPLMIARPDISMVLLDSLNKRVGFLREVCRALSLDAECIHARAEDAGHDAALRGKFGIALSRAVAGVPVLTELTVPFLAIGGRSLMYKGSAAADELRAANHALTELRAGAELIRYDAPWGERAVIAVTKHGETPGMYPRKAGMPSKAPL